MVVRTAFRFLSPEPASLEGDAEFWRDVSVAERLTRHAAAGFLRDLCHSRAVDECGGTRDLAQWSLVALREAELVSVVEARGYAVAPASGADPVARAAA